MRSLVSLIALISIFLSGTLPGFAQVVRRPAVKSAEPTDVRENLTVQSVTKTSRSGDAQDTSVTKESDLSSAVTSRRGNGRIRPAMRDTKFASVESYNEGRGVWVRWQMETEISNAGFRVYRTSRTGRTLVSNFLLRSLFM